MKIRKLYKQFSNLNIFILAVLLFLGFATLYFFYNRQRSQAIVYVSVSLLRPQNIPISAPYNWVPYWIGNSINIGDKEISPLRGLNAVVVEKEAYEAQAYGQYVFLLLKINSIRDRSGLYLFKNKPISAGGIIDLKLINAQIQGLVTYIGPNPPQYETKKITLMVEERNMEFWQAENIKVGSTIKNNKGQEIAKIIDKKVSTARSQVFQTDVGSGRSETSLDPKKNDVQLTLEIQAKKINNVYYFSELQKVKVNESLSLSFQEIGNLNLRINSILRTEE